MTYTNTTAPARRIPWRLLGWSAAVALFLLPLLAMQFSDAVRWTFADFALAGVLIGGVGVAFEAAVLVSPNARYTLAFAVTLAGTFLLLWSNAAVGVIGAAANDANALYYVMLGIGIALGVVGRLRPSAMARAAAATALMQALITAVAIVVGLGRPENSALELLAINGVFVFFWVCAAALFHGSARTSQRPQAGARGFGDNR